MKFLHLRLWAPQNRGQKEQKSNQIESKLLENRICFNRQPRSRIEEKSKTQRKPLSHMGSRRFERIGGCRTSVYKGLSSFLGVFFNPSEGWGVLGCRSGHFKPHNQAPHRGGSLRHSPRYEGMETEGETLGVELVTRLRHSPRYEGMETFFVYPRIGLGHLGLRHSPRYGGMETSGTGL